MMNTVSDMLHIDALRTEALVPLRQKLMDDKRFVGKSIVISGYGTAIHVTIAGRVGVSITKTWQQGFYGHGELSDYFETLWFEVVDDRIVLNHDMMKGFDDDEIEKIAEYILRLHDTSVMSEDDVSRMVKLTDPFTAKVCHQIQLDGNQILCLENKALLEPVLSILGEKKYVLQPRRERRIYELFDRLRG